MTTLDVISNPTQTFSAASEPTVSPDSTALPEFCQSSVRVDDSHRAATVAKTRSTDSPENRDSPQYDTKSYLEAVKRVCYLDPIISATVTTGNAQHQYKLTIQAYRATYGTYLYYSISCNIPWTEVEQWEHPFHALELHSWAGSTETTEIWNVVADNDLVRRMLEYLAMPDSELSPKIGNSGPLGYRAHLIRTLHDLWD